MFCFQCGSIVWQGKIFCKQCFIKPQLYYRRINDVIDHYYFYPWDKYVHTLVAALKEGRNQKSLEQIINYVSLPSMHFINQTPVFAAPSSKQKRYQKNHAWCLAKILGFENTEDVFLKKDEQKKKDRQERYRLRLSLKGSISVDSCIVIDDIVTTGATIMEMKRLVSAKKMTVVSLSYVSEKR